MNKMEQTAKSNLTELVFVIDKSGSMSGLENDTIGGFNSMLKEQQELEGEAYVTTVLFSTQHELLHDRINIKGVAPLKKQDYRVGGGTALFDALGVALQKIETVQKQTAEPYRADHVLFVIITDGEENSSKNYSAEKIKAWIKQLQDEQGWNFVFFGANIDTVKEATAIGVKPSCVVTYQEEKVEHCYRQASMISKTVRSGVKFSSVDEIK